MQATDYLIVGSSHAALEAIAAIRMHDRAGSITLVTRDRHLPYSPTILPYIVSGQAQANRVLLRDDAWFEAQNVNFVREDALIALDPEASTALFDSGCTWRYGKLLLATGARPLVPDIEGLKTVPFHVLRTLDDAIGLRAAIPSGRHAVVLGAGLIGMHAAENLVEAGLDVTIIERGPRVLPAYFGDRASALIADAFANRGLRMRFGQSAVAAARRDDGKVVLTLEHGETVDADILVVAVGVRPETRYLAGTGIDTGESLGILVDARMRTSVEHIWAAGDVVEAPLVAGGVGVNGILPSAVEQGRIAGMDMAGDMVRRYDGGVPLNTYTFFGHQAVSVGDATADGDGLEVHEHGDAEGGRYRRFVLEDGRLVGAAGIDEPLDGGILWHLIQRRVDLSPVKAAFLANPRDTARTLMSRIWR